MSIANIISFRGGGHAAVRSLIKSHAAAIERVTTNVHAIAIPCHAEPLLRRLKGSQ